MSTHLLEPPIFKNYCFDLFFIKKLVNFINIKRRRIFLILKKGLSDPFVLC